MRLAFTIIYNGLHHLKHKDYAHKMVDMFDKWVIVEGLSKNGGSTSWCNNLNIGYNSNDGTIEYLEDLKNKYPEKIIFEKAKRYWSSKDHQVNTCLQLLKGYENNWLWQIDIDEQWELEDLINAENNLEKSDKVCGAFKFIHYLCKNYKGNQLIGKGSWGDNYHNRLWYWTGKKFKSHEPPIIFGQEKIINLDQVYNHYSYYFEEDIIFKTKYYKGYGQLYLNWKKLQRVKFDYPLNLKYLVGYKTKIDIANSFIDEK